MKIPSTLFTKEGSFMSSPLNRTLLTFFFLNLACLIFARPPVQAEASELRQGTTGTDLPRLVVNDIKTDNRHGRTVLSLSISQEIKYPLTLDVPILIRTGAGDIRFDRTISASRTDMAFILPDPPLAVILDPDHEMKRQLDPSEIPPVWSRFREAEEKTVVLASVESRDIFAPLLDSLQGKNVKITTAQEIKNAELQKATLLFLGADNTAAHTLFAGRRFPSAGFSLDVRINPLDQRSVAVLVSSSSREETEAAIRQLAHYSDYSFLHFEKGALLEKRKKETISGQRYTLEELPAGAPTTTVSTFAGIIDKLAASRVVYVGETHTSVADHLLQFRIIQALYQKNPHLAIGMEMFPRSSQKALDAYIQGEIDTDDFLKSSKYFSVWGYDWRLFRDVFNFARTNRIPVIGLNLDQKIVGHIFKSGSPDDLSPEENLALPAERDLDLPGYTDRLRQMHDIHARGNESKGSLSGFIQAQGIWDEMMAQTIAAYLNKNPAAHMVVLAGTEHTRKDSGIPPRVARRLTVSQSSVFNILSENAPSDSADIADFFFMEPPGILPPPAKLGIVLEPVRMKDSLRLQITGLSPHGKAGMAGLKEKDILLAIGGHPVYDMDDVRIAMIDTARGDMVVVKVRRMIESQMEQDMEFPVVAQPLSMDKPHP
jgi:aminopeptidase N